MDWNKMKEEYGEYFFTVRCKCVDVATGLAIEYEGGPFLEWIYERTMRPKRLLDCGCATGVYVKAARTIDPSIEAYGFDMASYVIDHRLKDVEQYVFRHDVALEALPFEDEVFDLTLATDFFEHQHDAHVKFVVNEVCRVTGRYIFIRQPFTHFNVPYEDRKEFIASFNNITHQERLALVDRIPEITWSVPDPDCRLHPQERGMPFWLEMLHQEGFQEIELPEEDYHFPNICSINSWNMLLMEKSK